MAITPDLMDTEIIRRTMRVLPYEEAKAEATRFFEESLGENGAPTDWDLSFDEYLEEHKNSKLLFCWYGPRAGIVFSPSDHNGIWAGRLEGIKGKGNARIPTEGCGADSQRKEASVVGGRMFLEHFLRACFKLKRNRKNTGCGPPNLAAWASVDGEDFASASFILQAILAR